MSNRASYSPGPANLAHIEKDGENWTLTVVKTLRHPPEKVWQALTDPAELREWAPYDADANLGKSGSTVKLTTVGAPGPLVSESKVTRADAPKLLEFSWGGQNLRWELEAVNGGTRLTLWHNIHRNYIAMGAAGWQICLDVLDALLDNDPIGRMVGPPTMQFEGWQRLFAEYSKQFGIEPPKWSMNADKN